MNSWQLLIYAAICVSIYVVRDSISDILRQQPAAHTSMPVRSSEKPGELYLQGCDGEQKGNPSSNLLYPLQVSPVLWVSCNDAYEFTWMSDLSHDIIALSMNDRLKLARSMGFCPHRRCQLTDLGNALDDGHCPENLCYTKLERGSGSYGACCFRDGRFNSGSIIGYYNKTQPTAKPIYKRQRIVLDDPSVLAHDNPSCSSNDPSKMQDESYDSFINANLIYPGIIATQCPMESTSQDVLQMIVQQHVTVWIQLAPSATSRSRTCKHFPEEYDPLSLRSGHIVIDEVRQLPNAETLGLSHNRTAFASLSIGLRYRSPDPMKKSDDTHRSAQSHRHVFRIERYLDWEDFELPQDAHHEGILSLANNAANVIRGGGTVLISCKAGRGRTGTMAAVVVGLLEGISTHSQLVDAVVRMRESRDGLVETPKHFRFVASLLKLPSTAECSWDCIIYKAIADNAIVNSWRYSGFYADTAYRHVSLLLTMLVVSGWVFFAG